MKKLFIIILFIFSVNSQAQSEKEIQYFKQEIKDTFKKSSIVILRQWKEIKYSNLGTFDYVIETRYRIQYQLKDIAATEMFKTISKYKDVKKAMVKQIKPIGTEKIIYEFEDKSYPKDGINNDDVFDEEEDEDQSKEDEIALEDIEVGDIIEYQYEMIDNTKTNANKKILINNGKFENNLVSVKNYNIFKPLSHNSAMLNGKFSIVSSFLTYQLPKDLKLNYHIFNHPANFVVSEKNQSKIYELSLSNLAEYQEEEMSYPYLTYPNISYMVVQTNPSKIQNHPFQFVNYPVSEKEITDLIRNLYLNKNYISHFNFYLNTKTSSTPFVESKLSDFFKSFDKTFTKKSKTNLEKLNLMHEYLTNNNEINDFQFGVLAETVILARYCKHLGLKFKLMACQPKFNGNYENIVSPYDLYWGLYVDNQSEPLFITNFTKSSNIYQKFGYFSGTKVILIDADPNIANQTVLYPVVDSKTNGMDEKTILKLINKDSFEYQVHVNPIYRGNNKQSISSNISNYFYIEELYTFSPFFGYINYDVIFDWKTFKDTAEIYPEFRRIPQSLKELRKRNKNYNMIDDLYSDYEFEDIRLDSFVVTKEDGFEDKESENFEYNVYFKTKSLIKKTSDANIFVMSLGRLVTTQFSISNYKADERKTDIHNSHLRTIQWSFEIDLPKNMKPLNINSFNQSIKTKGGEFISKLEEKNGKLIMTVTKAYTTHFLPKNEWSEMVDFLQAAISFYNLELILEKQN